MGRGIVKLAADEFVEWSTIVDAPVTEILSKSEMQQYLYSAYGSSSTEDSDRRLALADANGTSFRDSTVLELLSYNRAGDREETITLDQIRGKYRKGSK